MTIEANIVPGGRRYRVRTAEERVRAFAKAERHSRVVAVLRKALPVIAVAVLASYFISTRLSVSVGDVTASIGAIEVADGNLRMINPKLEGCRQEERQICHRRRLRRPGHQEPQSDQAARHQGRSRRRRWRLVAHGGDPRRV